MYVTIDYETVFLSGGMTFDGPITDKCYSINISTSSFLPKQNMNLPRCSHGGLKAAQEIFAFGGNDENFRPMKSAEVYDLAHN